MIPRNAGRIPKLRLHKSSGKAAVMLDGQYLYLGRYGTPEAQERYDRAIAEWLRNGRRSAGTGRAQLNYDKATVARNRAAEALDDDLAATTVDEVLAAYLAFAEKRYRRDGKPLRELGHIKKVMAAVRRLYGQTAADEFGPRALKIVREQFVAAGHNRLFVNQNAARIVRIWKWAAAEEIVPAPCWHALQSVPGLGHSEAPASRKIGPVADHVVDATLPFCGDEIRALVELQRLTGARSGELVIMRTGDIDQSGAVWGYKPARHKTASRGHERLIYFGSKAQAILRPWLRTSLWDYLFSPFRCRERRYAAMRAKRKHVQPSQISRKRAKPRKLPGEHWTVASYANAVENAIRKANVAIAADNTQNGTKRPLLPHWHPHQLRHSAATTIRREFGLEVAKAVLGHATLQATQFYAEADANRAREVAKAIG